LPAKPLTSSYRHDRLWTTCRGKTILCPAASPMLRAHRWGDGTGGCAETRHQLSRCVKALAARRQVNCLCGSGQSRIRGSISPSITSAFFTSTYILGLLLHILFAESIVMECPHVRYCPDTVAKVESCRSEFFSEALKRETIGDTDSLSRATEVAYEFSVRR
jgi:hypothetical protein